MHTIVEFFKGLFEFFVSINLNAFNTIWYWFSKNWFVLLSLTFIIILCHYEIKIKTDHLVDDQRDIY